jgi:hypothetical protein
MPTTIKLSASRMATFMSCRRKYWFRYIEKLEPRVRETPLSFGEAVHNGLEWLFNNRDSIYVNDASLLREAMAEAYTADELQQEGAGLNMSIAVLCVQAFNCTVAWREWEFIDLERWFEVPSGHGRRIHGRWDGLIKVDGSSFLLEHKTVAGSVSERRIHHLLWDQQASMYIAAAHSLGFTDVKGILYNFIPKPTIEQATATPMEKRKYKKDGELYANMRDRDETDEEYLARVVEWYESHATPDYFRQHIVTRNARQIEATMKMQAQVASDIRRCETEGRWYPNPSSCAMVSCPFASVCLEDTPEARRENFVDRNQPVEKETANEAW